jgi:hypothetical protein
MSTFKRAKVVMLPTNQTSNLTLGGSINKNKLGIVILDNKHPDSVYDCYVDNLEKGMSKYSQNTKWLNFQHLYILSNDKDEEIKEGDWIYHNLDDKPIKYDKGISNSSINNPKEYGYKKIIATTDTSLSLDKDGFVTFDLGYGKSTLFPQPSQSFIKKYVEAYNTGKPITDVMVEYCKDERIHGLNLANDKDYEIFKNANSPIVNPKDNTITIKKVKDSWSREEVKQLCFQAFINHKCINGKIKPSEAENLLEPFNKWIEVNL